MARLVTNFAARMRSPTWYEIFKMYTPDATRLKLMDILKEKAKHAARSQLAHKMRNAKGFYTLEMAPPNAGDIAKIQADIALMREFIGTGCYKYLTVRQALLLFLVCTEVGLWFFMGETIGKGSFVGYKV